MTKRPDRAGTHPDQRGPRRAGGDTGVAARRAATEAAILAAAAELFGREGPESATVRAIAARAGVSHALVHRYFGSKHDVYLAALRQDESVILSAAAETGDLLEAMRVMLREGLRHHLPYLRLLAHSALHDVPFEESIGRFAATERLVELAEIQADAATQPAPCVALEPRLAVAGVVALYLGWAATAPWVSRAAGLGTLHEEDVEDGLERIFTCILANVRWVAAEGDGAGD